MKKYFKYIVLCAVLLIPFMYSFFYLKSYWNPYGNLKDLGVAIVNNDKTTKNSLSSKYIKGLKESETCKFEVVNEEKANDGLQNGKYYAIVTIPKNFTENINNIKSKDRQITTITYTPNQKTNYIASQIISRILLESQKSLEEEISSNVVKNLSDNLNEVPNKLQEISDGVGQIKEGTETLSNKYAEFDNGINSAVDGSIKINDGLNTLSEKTEPLKNGINDLYNGSVTLEKGINDYTNTSLSIIQLAAGFCQNESTYAYYNGYLNAYSNGQINCQNIGYIVNSLKSGSNSLKVGANGITNGLSSINQSTPTLINGINELKNGSDTLTTGLKTISNGSKQINDGINKINDGTNLLKTNIDNGIESTKDELKNLEGLDKFMSSPIEIDEKPTVEVKEYGISFTPLFLSIGLWVGALMSYVVLFFDQEHRFKYLDKENKGIKQNIIYIVLSIIFGFITALLLKLLLGFNLANPALYYTSAILISITFMSIIQFLIRVFKDVGKFLALIILVLQLAASGGTFPVETISNGFRLLTNFLPMTYSIRLIKEAIIETTNGLVSTNIIVLLLFAIIPFILTTVYDIIKKKEA